MTDLVRLPEIIVRSTPIFLDAGAALGTGEWTAIGASMSKVVAVQNHTIEGLIEMLHFKCYEARRAFERSQTWYGRFYNTCSGANSQYVPLGGQHFMQLAYQVQLPLGEEKVSPRDRCYLRRDIAEAALRTMKAAYKVRE
ncbi:MAG: hypothetical protein ACPGVK_09555 [Halocynthiibacter sp.]